MTVPYPLKGKLGGDHGQGSMKMEFQIANVPKSNSPQNTVVFALFEGKDTRNNLATILDAYREQVKDLNSTTWRNVRFIVPHGNLQHSKRY